MNHWLVVCVPYDVEKAQRFILFYRQVTPPLGISVASDARLVTVSGRASLEDFRRTIAQNLSPQVFQMLSINPSRDFEKH